MTLTQFDHGYWYAIELKQFAADLGIPSVARLRKDELERAIKQFLRSGTIGPSKKRKPSASETAQERDTDLGLRLDRRVVRYTNNAVTKLFLEQQAKKLAPGYRRRSGARYRLNRWRERQLDRGVEITYRDVVEEYVRLSQPTERFARMPHGRYVNFVSDFLAHEPRATTADASAAWQMLKRMDCPKTYQAWRSRR
jgi:ribosome modulation factor